MPITQMRMNALIQAARDYQQALRRAIKITEEISQKSTRIPNTEPEKLRQLILALPQRVQEIGLLCNPLPSALVINDEDNHFRRRWSENNRQAAKMAAKRGAEVRPREGRAQNIGHSDSLIEETLPLRNTAPESISIIPQLHGSIEEEIYRAPSNAAERAAAKRKNAPPGLYDDDEPESGPLIARDNDEDTAPRMTPELQAELEAEADRELLGEEVKKRFGLTDPLDKGILPE